MTDLHRVSRASFAIDEPWLIPAGTQPLALCHSGDGSAPRLPTSVALFYDDEALSIVFNATDDHISARHRDHDAPLYEEDVVEVFLAPRRPGEYFEVEVSPIGTTFDTRIESPDGHRSTMRDDVSWNCRNLFAAVRVLDGHRQTFHVETAIRIPFASLDCQTPARNETWLGNFYRIDRHTTGDEFTSWRATGKTPPDFHVPSAFGRIVFE